jgi:hypothetical protein
MTHPSQDDHLQQAADVLEAENADLREMATALVHQIQGLRGAGCYRAGVSGKGQLAVARCYRQKRLRGP